MLDTLGAPGATVVVIEHGLEMIANADYRFDMGRGGEVDGGRVVATGTPGEIARDLDSVTGRHLAHHVTS